MSLSLPHGNCYWVRPGRILAGEYPGAADPLRSLERLRAHLQCGIRYFVDLTEEGELNPYHPDLDSESSLLGISGVEHHRFPISDGGVPSSKELMTSILDTIDFGQRTCPIVYVHCWGGIGRTGTVVGCHFVRTGHSGHSALQELATRWSGVEKFYRRPESPETQQQRDYVLSWREPPNSISL